MPNIAKVEGSGVFTVIAPMALTTLPELEDVSEKEGPLGFVLMSAVMAAGVVNEVVPCPSARANDASLKTIDVTFWYKFTESDSAGSRFDPFSVIVRKVCPATKPYCPTVEPDENFSVPTPAVKEYVSVIVSVRLFPAMSIPLKDNVADPTEADDPTVDPLVKPVRLQLMVDALPIAGRRNIRPASPKILAATIFFIFLFLPFVN